MARWLVKSEPDAFGWDDQVIAGTEPWTGVRNHSAKLNLQAMRLGEQALFYHSNVGKAVVGIVEVAREAYPDPTPPMVNVLRLLPVFFFLPLPPLPPATAVSLVTK